ILYSFFSFTEHTPFPGRSALLPCLGASLVIYSGQARFLGLLLRNPLSVGIGLISYSLYLIHWPLLIFYTYWKYAELVLWERLSLLLATIFLAALSWKFIEQPFRKGRGASQKRFVLVYIMLAGILLAAAAVVIQQKGLPNRISSKFSQVKDITQFHIDQYGGKGYPFVGMFGAAREDKDDHDVVLAGDSFVIQYATGLDPLFQQEDIRAKMVTDYACIVGTDITFFHKGKPDNICTEQNRLLFSSLQEDNNQPIILSQAWEWYLTGICDLEGRQIDFINQNRYHKFLINNLRKIRKEIGAERQLILIGNPPGSGNRNGIISCLNRPAFLPNNCLDTMVFPKKNGVGLQINQRLRKFAATEKNTWFFDPFEVFCKQDSCAALDYNNNTIWYSDGGHVSIDGSIKAADYFGPELVRIIRAASEQAAAGQSD
ncbi:MAG: acyltransferase, partial [Candidatus Electrothrix sp. AR3]|nr:acyltransferase [Candidatus Electrothrix sp. AR3]